MSTYHITIIGGDLRQCYMADYLQQSSHIVTCFNTMPFSYKSDIKTANSLKQALSDAEIVIGPVPFSKDKETIYSLATGAGAPLLKDFFELLRQDQVLAGGMIPTHISQLCGYKSIRVVDFMLSESLMLHNAYLTAEGLLSKLISETDFSLKDQNILILGYGNCGFTIGEVLKSMFANVFVFEQNEKRIALAKTRQLKTAGLFDLSALLPDFSLIINTIPAHILTEKQLTSLHHDCLIFDIASAPGGFSKEVMDTMEPKLFSCPGIPGKFMPKTAGKLIGDTILQSI